MHTHSHKLSSKIIQAGTTKKNHFKKTMSFFKPVDVFSFFPCQTEDFARLPLAITLTFMAFFIGFFMTFTFFMAFTFMAIFFTSTFLQIVRWLEQVLSQIGFPPNCWERLVFKWTTKSVNIQKKIYTSKLPLLLRNLLHSQLLSSRKGLSLHLYWAHAATNGSHLSSFLVGLGHLLQINLGQASRLVRHREAFHMEGFHGKWWFDLEYNNHDFLDLHDMSDSYVVQNHPSMLGAQCKSQKCTGIQIWSNIWRLLRLCLRKGMTNKQVGFPGLHPVSTSYLHLRQSDLALYRK